MRLRVLTNLTGPDFKLVAGDITDRFDGAAAQRLIAYGNAVPVSDETIERAVTAPAPERRTKRKGR